MSKHTKSLNRKLIQKATARIKDDKGFEELPLFVEKCPTESDTEKGNGSKAWIGKIVHYAKDHGDDFKKDLMSALINTQFAGDESELDNERQGSCNNFVSAVLSEIDNFALKLSNKAKQVRFSPAVLRLAMNLYNKSPTAYHPSPLCLRFDVQTKLTRASTP